MSGKGKGKVRAALRAPRAGGAHWRVRTLRPRKHALRRRREQRARVLRQAPACSCASYAACPRVRTLRTCVQRPQAVVAGERRPHLSLRTYAPSTRAALLTSLQGKAAASGGARGGERKKIVSKTSRAGLSFPVGRVMRYIRRMKVSEGVGGRGTGQAHCKGISVCALQDVALAQPALPPPPPTPNPGHLPRRRRRAAQAAAHARHRALARASAAAAD
jgi:hypothetical protein